MSWFERYLYTQAIVSCALAFLGALAMAYTVRQRDRNPDLAPDVKYDERIAAINGFIQASFIMVVLAVILRLVIY